MVEWPNASDSSGYSVPEIAAIHPTSGLNLLLTTHAASYRFARKCLSFLLSLCLLVGISKSICDKSFWPLYATEAGRSFVFKHKPSMLKIVSSPRSIRFGHIYLSPIYNEEFTVYYPIARVFRRIAPKCKDWRKANRLLSSIWDPAGRVWAQLRINNQLPTMQKSIGMSTKWPLILPSSSFTSWRVRVLLMTWPV